VITQLQPSAQEDAPDWRWRRALHERERERAGDRDFSASPDLTVRLARRYLETWDDPVLQGSACRELMPGFSFLRDLYMENSPGCTRHALEAAILAKATPEFIRAQIHYALSPFLLRMYELLFFDVRGRMDSPFWVERHIFVPAAAEPREEVRASALQWKVIGYLGGTERLVLDCLRGTKYGQKDRQWLAEHVVDQHSKDTLKFAHSSSKLPKEISAPAYQRTIEGWQGQLYDLGKLAEKIAEGEVPEKLITFNRRTRMKEAGEDREKLEKLDQSIPKYADGDLTK